MRIFVVAFAIIAVAASAAIDSPLNEYLPPSEDTVTSDLTDNDDSALLADDGYRYKTLRRLKYRQRRDVSETANEYLPPADEATAADLKSGEQSEESAVLGDNGYEYKTVRRLKYRQRRDVSEIANEYLPPAEETSEAVAELKSLEEPEESAVLGENGYEYKTVRRLKYRQRRDVSEIANEYLPPTEETTKAVAELKSVEEPEESAVLGENGYEYKTVRRLKYRQRRDVSEVANEYLPPAEETTESVAELKFIEEPEESAVLGENGYEYKTVRRLKYRQRRDVSEIAKEYLPPAEETTEAVAELKSAEEPEESAVLGENGYEYKTVRRLKYRQRRDVSEIANEYLPPAEETTETVAELKSVEEPEESAVLGENGYEYKTVRRLKYRQRRDVSEIANEYLPPAEETTEETTEAELKSAEEPEESAVLSENGYEYKTVRRLKYRQRRDVSEIANEYLPPAEETTQSVAELKSVEEPEESAVLGENGYEYKTVRRLKYRQRRDVSEIANEYLPPAEETTEAVAELKSVEEPEESAVLGENGYEYKTVRRLKYRQRRDVSEIANEYLPPAEETTEAIAELKSVEEPEESAVLGNNGYEYKTVRRLKYRQRRDVSEIANEYLPPAEETTEAVAELKSVEEPEESAVLGENGYEYKTVRRLKYRQRRDVPEIANEYLPPAEETTEAVAELKSAEEPEESAVLGENGYEYKTVRRLKYRQRRDVSEIANEYLPPAEETTEAVAELKSVEEPEESAVLGENGYEYKTVRRLKYRQRRDVSEIANEYLPPAEETTEAVAELKSAEEPEESAVLGENGYEYKTVRRLKYRQRRDVSEIANEYLPPAEETTEAVAELKSVEEPEESAVLGENGYEYKTVRRLKYRQRRDVSEIANEYLPPAEEITKSVAELKSVEVPEESAVLGENGYEYKTVRRLKYRQRRDVSEIANEYLPPAEETTEAVAELKSVEEPEQSAVLGENGYEYKTVHRLKYRQRRY
ncbi:paternally-expressed gene 3 protein [Lucilia cuprina]|uniref:paternally-expressed gene 3 protein n=1 Tax=Lucilia cuprina TaxID=7375 RepID=UPI001F05FEF1|nr:paternally-expressed gene 3 protein [Lucilia cuprina]